MSRIFLLSPAHSGGKRAAMLTRPGASFELARQVQIGAAALGDVFTFCSGLYFRGKLAYARRFADAADGLAGIQVITPSRGLLSAETMIGTCELTEFAAVDVHSEEDLYTTPLKQSALALLAQAPDEIILLGSVATGKYLEPLLPIFGERLRFPLEFKGRGDMSRGALMLRSVAADAELQYGPVPSPPRRVRSRPASRTV